MNLSDPKLVNNVEAQSKLFPEVLNYVGDLILTRLAEIPDVKEFNPKKKISAEGNLLNIYSNSSSFHFDSELTFKYLIFKHKNSLPNIGLTTVVKDIIIPESLHSQGIASLIIKTWEAAYLEKGYKGYFLAHDVRDDIGLAFWSSLGYLKLDETQKYQSLMYKVISEG